MVMEQGRAPHPKSFTAAVEQEFRDVDAGARAVLRFVAGRLDDSKAADQRLFFAATLRDCIRIGAAASLEPWLSSQIRRHLDSLIPNGNPPRPFGQAEARVHLLELARLESAGSDEAQMMHGFVRSCLLRSNPAR